MNKISWLLLAFAGLVCPGFAQKVNQVVISKNDTEKDIIYKAANIVPTARQLRWQQLELTAFFHFGVNTFTGKEWGTGKEDPAIFNPSELNAEQWVTVAKDAGIRQVIITAKHHDGFCLWPSKFTEHSVKNSPWKLGKGDVVKDVATACKKLGMGFGIYLSPWDMNSRLYGTEAYNDFFVDQLTELLTQYGQVDEVWFDGANGEGPNGKKQVYDFDRWYKLIRNLQPAATIAIMGPDVRWVGTESGHGRVTEWSVVPVNNLNPAAVAANSQTSIAFNPSGDMMGDDLGSREKIWNAKGLAWYPAETDVSIRPGWFYHEEENEKVKTAKQLLDIYFNSVGRNGVLLLNIPPDKRGLIHEKDINSLKEWKGMRDNIFQKNILANAIIVSGKKTVSKLLTDDKIKTGFTANESDTTTVFTMRLPSKQNCNVLLLQENITQGQRVEKFVLEYWKDDQWHTAAEGTTIGYKRLTRFATVTADIFRLRILSSRLNPVLAEIGLYMEQKY